MFLKLIIDLYGSLITEGASVGFIDRRQKYIGPMSKENNIFQTRIHLPSKELKEGEHNGQPSGLQGTQIQPRELLRYYGNALIN